MSRIIGIRHRVKRTAEGEAHPTQVVIEENGKKLAYNLEDEQAELDFVHGRYPIKYRDAIASDDSSQFLFRQLKLKELKKDETAPEGLANLVITQGKTRYLVTKVPVAFEGLMRYDKVAMSLGGAGDNLAFAMSRRLQDLDGCVLRIPPHVLKEYRGEDKENDATHLVNLVYSDFGRFYLVTARDRNLIRVRELYRLMEATMKDRIACDQRLRQLVIGQIFCSDDGLYPEGALEKAFDTAKANDPGYQALLGQEKNIETKLSNALGQLPVYNEIFAGIEGVGTRISARIISIIGDIRLFEVQPDTIPMARLYDLCQKVQSQYYDPILDKIKGDFTPEMNIWHKLGVALQYYRRLGNSSAVADLQSAIEGHAFRSKLRRKAHQQGQAKLKAYLGVHLVKPEDGEAWVFPRKRRGARCNWSPTGRQALYLVGEQCTRRPSSVWGQKQRENKRRAREKHPEPIKENGKTRYSDAHIHKMGTWRTLSQFACWLFDEWVKLEHQPPALQVAQTPKKSKKAA